LFFWTDKSVQFINPELKHWIVIHSTTIKKNDYCLGQIQLYLLNCILIRLHMLTFLYTNTVFGGANVIVPFLSDSRRNSFEYFSFARISHYCIRCLHCSLSESRFSLRTPPPRYGTKRKRRPTRICTIKRLLFVSPSSTFIPADNHMSPPRADPSHRIKRRKKLCLKI
jgi:hypothetical protein